MVEDIIHRTDYRDDFPLCCGTVLAKAAFACLLLLAEEEDRRKNQLTGKIHNRFEDLFALGDTFRVVVST